MTQDQLVDYVRMLMSDRGPKNFLLNYSTHFSSADIIKAAELAAMKYGTMPPLIGSPTWQNMPPYLAILGAMRFLLSSESVLQLRNQASMTTDDMEMVGIDDKWSQYLQLQAEVAREWDQLAKDFKISRNADAFDKAIPSGYRHIGRFNT
jgi:hypothetical protein